MHRLSLPRSTNPPHTGQTPWEPVSGPTPDVRRPEQEEPRRQAWHSRQRHQTRSTRHRLDRHHGASSTQAPSLPQPLPPSLLRSQTESHRKHCQDEDNEPQELSDERVFWNKVVVAAQSPRLSCATFTPHNSWTASPQCITSHSPPSSPNPWRSMLGSGLTTPLHACQIATEQEMALWKDNLHLVEPKPLAEGGYRQVRIRVI